MIFKKIDGAQIVRCFDSLEKKYNITFDYFFFLHTFFALEQL